MKTIREVLTESAEVPNEVIEDMVLLARERAFNGEDPVLILLEFGIEIPMDAVAFHQILAWC